MAETPFAKLTRTQQLDLISSSFSNFIKYGLGLSPKDEQQKTLVKEIDEALKTKDRPKISVRSGHGTGNTFTDAALILYIGLTKYDAKIAITAPVSPQLEKILIPELRKLTNLLFPPLRKAVDVQKDGVKFANGNIAFARTARKENTEAIAGVHGSFVLYIVDEASGVYEGVFEVIEGALTGSDYLMLMTGNPTRNVGTFADSHLKANISQNYRTVHLSSERSNNVDTKWIQYMKDTYGEDSDIYRVRVKGEFPKGNVSSLFDTTLIEEAMNPSNRLDINPNSRIIYGIDVARYGSDSTVIARRQDKFIRILDTLTNQNTTEVAYHTNSLTLKESSLPTIFVDTIGYGAGVYDRLREFGYDVRDGNVSFKAENFRKFLNKRAEIYFNLKEFLEKGGTLQYDEQLKEELLSISYKFNSNGKIQLVSKQELKEILGRSPDKADAVALTCYTNIREDTTLKRDINYYKGKPKFNSWEAI